LVSGVVAVAIGVLGYEAHSFARAPPSRGHEEASYRPLPDLPTQLCAGLRVVAKVDAQVHS
jgi:hypothetical protein